jgi:hypothetical protein
LEIFYKIALGGEQKGDRGEDYVQHGQTDYTRNNAHHGFGKQFAVVNTSRDIRSRDGAFFITLKVARHVLQELIL